MARSLRASCLLVAWLATATHAAGQLEPSAIPTEQAAEAFEAGVASFERGDYRAAAIAFLRADELSPSAEALSNAIAAARRANDHLLVLSASRRAIAREAEAPALAASAREALVQAERHVSRLELGCKAEVPCSLTLDGAAVNAGTNYVLPGIHAVVASADGRAPAERRFETVPGSTYRIALEPLAEAPAERPPARPKASTPREAPHVEASRKPLPPVAFWAGVGVTGALTAVTIWSGVDVVKQRDDLPARPSESQADEDADRIRRTDILFVATVVVAALTTGAGIALVDWDSGQTTAARPLGFSF